jgi:molecular chaperone HtpG
MMDKPMTEQSIQAQPFQAEVSRLLDIVVHALYSQKEIFLRELISNAADACDRLRYLAITKPELAQKYAIHLICDVPTNRLTVSDNGIGMSRDEMQSNLGTIARSGTKAFMEQLSGDAKKDMNLIGQFGVGFYSAFMVADKVEVISRRAGEDKAWKWESDGKGTFTITEAQKNLAGTDVILHLKQEADEYLDKERLKHIVTSYSDHVPVPVYYGEDEGAQLNRATSLWMQPKSEITADQYKEFYHHVAHAYDEPMLTMHWRAEGAIEYTGLIFIPTQKPYDMVDPRRTNRLKLYVKRVFITDQADGLVPPYLRFLRGVIDSEDLPLNISREMLQHNPILSKMKNGITRRVLSELQKLSTDKDVWAKFWDNYGAVLKEGLYEDVDNRDDLLKLFCARTTKGDGLVTLDQYIARMPKGQEAIYYITGENAENLANSPQLEGFRARGIEVFLLNDPIDDFWLPLVGVYKETPLKSATQGEANLDAVKPIAEKETPQPPAQQTEKLIAALKELYGETVKDVRASKRLTESPVCIVSGDGELDIHMERLLKQNKQLKFAPKRILEINPSHPLIARMAKLAEEGLKEPLTDLGWLLLDQARLLEGEAPSDPLAFSQRLTRLAEKAVA